MKKQYKIVQKILTLKRKIYADDIIKNFIFDNINYRRKVWNDFVEASRMAESVFDFDPVKFKCGYFNTVEKPNNVYKKYCTGISEQVMKDVLLSQKAMRTAKVYSGMLHFKRFDRFKGSFKIYAKPAYRKLISNEYRFNSRVYIESPNKLLFRVRGNEPRLQIVLEEGICDYITEEENIKVYYDSNRQHYFHEEDIKEIGFTHEFGNFYVVLSVWVSHIIEDKPTTKIGIDLGIHNPITCYNGESFKILRMTNKELSRIAYLERRLIKLQKIMDRKYHMNNGKTTKNYRKVHRKFRVTLRKIFRIRLNWRRQISKKICSIYNVIVIDPYSIPSKDDHLSSLPKKTIRYINKFNRMHGMFLLYERIIQTAERDGCEIYKAPKYTTRSCCFCGHKNPKIPLYQRIFTCEACGTTLDRDLNAAMNCYDADVRKLKLAVC